MRPDFDIVMKLLMMVMLTALAGYTSFDILSAGIKFEISDDLLKVFFILAVLLLLIVMSVAGYLKSSDDKAGIAVSPTLLGLQDEIQKLKNQYQVNSVSSGGDNAADEDDGGWVLTPPDQVIVSLSSVVDKLESEVKSLEKRANVNVIIGIVSAFIIVVLSIGVFFAVDFSSGVSYLPLISVVLIIELFSFFFLRLYRKCLDDIKFYRNEISNFESLKSGYLMAREHCPDKIYEIVKEVILIERNFVLRKGETTVDAERARVDGAVIEKAFSLFRTSKKIGG